VNYANAGGRIMVHHWGNSWIQRPGPFSEIAAWSNGGAVPTDSTYLVNQSFDGGVDLANWMQLIGATTTLGEIPATNGQLRNTFISVDDEIAQLWLSTPTGIPLLFTFETPIVGDKKCGKVLFADIHAGACVGGHAIYPNECPNTDTSASVMMMEYFLYYMTAFLDEPPVCKPKHSCEKFSAQCGEMDDGCGNFLDCGYCSEDTVCHCLQCQISTGIGRGRKKVYLSFFLGRMLLVCPHFLLRQLVARGCRRA